MVRQWLWLVKGPLSYTASKDDYERIVSHSDTTWTCTHH